MPSLLVIGAPTVSPWGVSPSPVRVSRVSPSCGRLSFISFSPPDAAIVHYCITPCLHVRTFERVNVETCNGRLTRLSSLVYNSSRSARYAGSMCISTPVLRAYVRLVQGMCQQVLRYSYA